MAEVKSEFYVTLPSNACMEVFPNNTQSHFTTKLSTPIMLKGEWEVGLVEAIIPRSYFNITLLNNSYTLTQMKEITEYDNIVKHEIPLTPLSERSGSLFTDLNNNIQQITHTNGVNFVERGENVTIQVWRDEFELHIDSEKCDKLLYILNQPLRSLKITNTASFKFRNITDELDCQFFYLIDKRKSKDETIYIPLQSTNPESESLTLFGDINENIQLIAKTDKLKFVQPKSQPDTVFLQIPEGYEIHISSQHAPYLLNALNSPLNDLLLQKTQIFLNVKDYEKLVSSKEYFLLKRRAFKEGKVEMVKVTENLTIPIGQYSTTAELFDAIRGLKFILLSDKRVKLLVPKQTTVVFGSGIQQLLGFNESSFMDGEHISNYPIELNAGITEIFVYSDIIEPHRIGETSASLLRIIPLGGEKDDQIVRVYNNPLYFSLKSNYIETINIELRASTGARMIFNSGKTFLILSFRQR